MSFLLAKTNAHIVYMNHKCIYVCIHMYIDIFYALQHLICYTFRNEMLLPCWLGHAT